MKISRPEFEQLALEQLDAVDRVARSLTRGSSDADDLVQETFVRAFRAADSFDLQSFGIRPWLFRILHNLHTTRATRESRQPKAIPAEHLQAFAGPSEPFSLDSLTGMDNELEAAMKELPADLSTTLMLWAIDDLAYREIAEVMNVPIGTVMSRLHRARQKLAERLQHIAPRGREFRE
jgi:RNA polymerase sigma-70 factor, ECF subfamily